MNYNILGENIRKARKARNITQEKLAEYVEVSAVFISQIENGAGKPSLETVCKISNALQVSIDDLVKNSIDYSPVSNYEELILLLSNKSTAEVNFIITIVREILGNIHILKNTHNT